MELTMSIADWRDRVDQVIWSAGETPPHPEVMQLELDLCQAALPVREILRELSDECLAQAVSKSIWFEYAFEELFVARYTGYLARWFYRWGIKAGDCADLIQDIYCQFLVAELGSFNPQRPFRPYLRKAAWNLAMDRHRRRKVTVALDNLTDPTSCEDPVNEAEARELTERLEKVLNRTRIAGLPETAVYRLSMQGYTTEEIAAELKIEPRRVFTLLFRIRRLLEKELKLPDQRRERRPTEDFINPILVGESVT